MWAKVFKALQMLLHLHHQGEGSQKSRGSYGEAAGGLAPYSSSCPREARHVSGLLETVALVWNQFMYPECTAHSKIKDVCILHF